MIDGRNFNEFELTANKAGNSTNGHHNTSQCGQGSN